MRDGERALLLILSIWMSRDGNVMDVGEASILGGGEMRVQL